MSKRAAEGFTAVPNRVIQAWEREQLNFNQVGLLLWLTYRCWRDRGETHFTLRTLNDEVGWPRSMERLRQELTALAEAGSDRRRITWARPEGAVDCDAPRGRIAARGRRKRRLFPN